MPGCQGLGPSTRHLRMCSQEAPLLSLGKLPPGLGGHTHRGLTGRQGVGQAPVGPLSDHLGHADVEGPVGQVGAGQLVNPELGSCDRLPRWDLGQVEAEFLPVGLLVAQGAVELHCKTRWAGVHSRSGLGLQGPRAQWGPGSRAAGEGRFLLGERAGPQALPRVLRGPVGPVVRCPAQHLTHSGANKGSFRFWPPSLKPSSLSPAPCWLWDPQVRQRGPGSPLQSWTSDPRQKRPRGGQGHD